METDKRQFRIILEVCPSDNHLYGQSGKIRFMYKDAKEWKEYAQTLAKQQWEGEPTKNELMADIVFFFKRDRDVMGSCKLLFDSFQKIVYDNDSQFVHVNLHKMRDTVNPRVEIFIQEI